MDSLKLLQEKIIEANRLYSELRTTIRIPEDQPYQQEGIKILSEPFLKGVFTLAVIGQMSAGKSAFINALLEDQDILPTNHFQTTCTITEIVWSKHKKLVVTYGDNSKKEYEGEEILSRLKEVAAIDPKFDAIPINHVNQYILEGLTEEQIVDKRETLKELSKRPFSIELLKEYIKGKNVSNIPINVHMEYPLSESFKGWRIVDTPGIGALGGIDKTTKAFLSTENVDSAVFVFNGCDHIESNANYEMISNSYRELTDVAKERTFFVITHVGKSDCYINLERTKSTALDLFSKGDISIPESRFFAVDSMLSLLNDIAITKYGLDPCIFLNYDVNLDAFSEEELDMYNEMINMLKRLLHKEHKEINSENLHKKIIEIAGFVKLKQTLGDFAKDAKKEAYNRVLTTILDDFQAFGSSKKEELELWKSKLTKSSTDFELELAAKKIEIEEYRNTLNEKFNEIIYDYTGSELTDQFSRSYGKFEKKIAKANNFYDMEIAYDNFLDWFPLEEEIIVSQFTSRCKDLQVSVNTAYPNISIPPVDFEKAKEDAIKKATHTETYTVKVKKSGLLNYFKSWFGAKSAFRTEERKRTYVDNDEKIQAEKDALLLQVKKSLKDYCAKFKTEFVDPTAKNINQQLRKLVEVKQKEYDNILEASLNAEEQQKTIDLVSNELSIIEGARKNIETFKING